MTSPIYDDLALRELDAEICCVRCHATAGEHPTTLMDWRTHRLAHPCPGAVLYASGRWSSELAVVEVTS